ncbi:MAG: hypothetical protein JST48_10760 [Bacteroidetes bacterium]|nr:hypothetical protein [Bacteroidota bacterium]
MKKLSIRFFLLVCTILLWGGFKLYAYSFSISDCPPPTQQAQAEDKQSNDLALLISETAPSDNQQKILTLDVKEIKEENEDDSERDFLSQKKHFESNFVFDDYSYKPNDCFLYSSEKKISQGVLFFPFPSCRQHLLLQVFRI